jgi:hypothetical protein
VVFCGGSFWGFFWQKTNMAETVCLLGAKNKGLPQNFFGLIFSSVSC